MSKGNVCVCVCLYFCVFVCVCVCGGWSEAFHRSKQTYNC